jgi:hypothetical protein
MTCGILRKFDEWNVLIYEKCHHLIMFDESIKNDKKQ